MTTKQEYIERLIDKGNAVQELLESLYDDPVVSAYLKQTDSAKGYSWQNTERFTLGLIERARDEWDDLIGDLQRAGIYQLKGWDGEVLEAYNVDESEEENV